ncbi:MAG: cache domain-containing protein [candidate division Zixibacteria bacterium]|nr:cache domain-containing protein [candidate division Zixibacteria bacterium]
MRKRPHTRLIPVWLKLLLCVAAVVLLFGQGCDRSEAEDIQQATFGFLRQVLDERRAMIMDHMSELHQIAESALVDTVIQNTFRIMLNPSHQFADPSYSAELVLHLDMRFVTVYGDFYDMLFVDSTGYVFHSIRQESDFHTRLGEDGQATLLSESLRSGLRTTFVDFEKYRPSKEPAAFHIVAVEENGVVSGWIVFQHAINRINSILMDRAGMGRTGEVYLVNSHDIMLTDSRFIKERTMMELHLDTEATQNARNRGRGNKLIMDYRSRPVYSVHEQFSFLGVPWIIVAEVDEGEVITAHFRRQLEDLSPKIKAYLKHEPHVSSVRRYVPRSDVKVDMNEYGSIRAEGTISTVGVSTCTAITISLPGQFSYMAHISPTDDTYTKPLARSFLGDSRTDVLQSLLERVLAYEIYPYELICLEVSIVATSDKSLISILTRLIEYDIQLSQVKIMYNPAALYANVYVESVQGLTTVEWHFDESTASSIETSESAVDLGRIVSNLIHNRVRQAS